jgi:hypothetical protein
MQLSSLKQGLTLVAFAGLSGFAATAHANRTYASFVDVSGSLSADGWNQLNRTRVGSALTEAQLVAGTVANAAGSGDGVLTRVSGNHYPAGFGLYGGGSVLTFTDSTVAAGTTQLVFQGIINNFDNPFSLTLSVNGGAQALAASSSTFVSTGTVADLYTYTWDLSTLPAVSSYQLTLNAGFSQMLAFQVDQVNVTAAVPEPSTYALLAGGLALIGGVARRRQRAAANR